MSRVRSLPADTEPPLRFSLERVREAGSCRCLCGSLLARWVEEGIELKCRRCRRVVVIAYPPGDRRAPG